MALGLVAILFQYVSNHFKFIFIHGNFFSMVLRMYGVLGSQSETHSYCVAFLEKHFWPFCDPTTNLKHK